MKKKLRPISLKASKNTDEAWMYVNSKSIEVFVYREGANALSCKITEAQLKNILS